VGDTAGKPARSGVHGVDSPEVKKKLPTEITSLSEVNNNTYTYLDPMEMLEDMKRLRRKFGWTASWMGSTNSGRNYAFHMVGPSAESPDDEFFAQFEIRVDAVYQKLWPSLYPNDPNITKLRSWFFTKRGPHKVANWLNETTLKEPPALPDAASAWSRLLSDDLV